MPPQDAPHPAPATYDSLATWLASALDAAAPATVGAPALRRLNRAEYANAIRDLLDLEVDVTALLPPDDSAFGFDNIGDLLVFSPTLLERYLSAADRVSAMAVGDPTTALGAQTYMVKGDESQATQLDGLPLGTVGGLAVTHVFPLDGEYELDLGLVRNNLDVIRGLEHTHQIEIAVDGRRVFLGSVGGEYDYSPLLTLRSGVAYEISPIDSATKRLVQIPDNNRVWLSVGASYKWSDAITLDVGYSHIFIEDGGIDLYTPTGGGPFRGDVEASVDLFSVGVRTRW